MKVNEIGKFDLDMKLIKFNLNKLSRNEPIVVITGEFSSGKTCFLNAFLNKKDFLPSSNGECTPVLIDIMQSDEKDINVRYKDGTEERVENTKENVVKYAKYDKSYNENILSISIPVNNEYLMKNTHIIDSPGTNTIIKEHEEITNYMLKRADIVLYVLNKTISQSDLMHISEISKFTDEIIFIITHIDELQADKTESREEKIEKLVDEVQSELLRKLSIEDAEVLPVGSKEAFEDCRYIDEIRACVADYLKNNSLKIVKNRVRKQLSVIFNEKLDSLKRDQLFFMANKGIDKEELDKKMKLFYDKISKFEEKNEIKMERLNIEFSEKNGELKKEIKKLFDKEESRLINRLLNAEEVTGELLESEFNNSRFSIGQTMKELVEDNINSILRQQYENLNSEVKDLISEIDIKLEAEIRKPIIEEIDDSDYKESMEDLMRMKQECVENLQEISEEIELSEAEKQEVKEQIKAAQESMDSYRQELMKLGVYMPDYEEVETESAGEAGAKLGRLIGEVADIALLFYNPAGAAGSAAKVADGVKDTVKVVSYAEKATEVAETANKAVKVKAGLDKAKKVVNAANKARGKAIEIGEDVIEKSGDNESIVSGIGKALDVLSIGYWGEKAGKKIGETIKPSKVLLVENEEQKIQWQQKKNQLDMEIEISKSKLKDLDEQLRNVDTIKEKRRIEKEILNKKTLYEEKMNELEENFKKEKEEDIQAQVQNYYKEEIGGIFKKESEKAESTALIIFNSAKEKINGKAKEDLQGKILDLEESIKKLNVEKADIEKQIQSNTALIEELSQYPQWINEWIENHECVR